jgi:hypothetical protein
MRTRLPHPRSVRRLRRELERPRREPIRQEDTVAIREDDPVVIRVREAGGPVDQASYACECGLVFVAPVSTTVACPHCHAAQPW